MAPHYFFSLCGRRQRQIVYRVHAGETLSSIARRHGMPVSTLARLNNMGAQDTLVKGQRLVIKASARRFRDEGIVSGLEYNGAPDSLRLDDLGWNMGEPRVIYRRCERPRIE